MIRKLIAPALLSLSTVFGSTAATAQSAQFEDPLVAQICEGDRARVQDDIGIIVLASDALARSTDPLEREIFQEYINASMARIRPIIDIGVVGCFSDIERLVDAPTASARTKTLTK